VGAYSVNILSLSNKIHHFNYDLGDMFFKEYGTDLVSQGSFHADVALNKHETFIEADFVIKGNAVLTCDRSLEPFDFPIGSDHRILFKFGDTNEEMSDEIIMIHRDTATLELGQYLYEFIALAIPIKKLHPKFQEAEDDEDENQEGKIVYTSSSDEKGGDNDDNDGIDPRWNILKKLK
jgi:uncharacterized metal-binding protein YceD (DUF177 family)